MRQIFIANALILRSELKHLHAAQLRGALPFPIGERERHFVLARTECLVTIDVVVPPIESDVCPRHPTQVFAIDLHPQVCRVREARERKTHEMPRVGPGRVECDGPRRGRVEHCPRVRLHRHDRALYNDGAVVSTRLGARRVAVPVRPRDRLGEVVMRVHAEVFWATVVLLPDVDDGVAEFVSCTGQMQSDTSDRVR